MKKIAQEIKDLAEFGALHNEDCCINFEDSRACDAGTPVLGCCENMEILGKYAEQLVGMVVEFISHDMKCDSEEQRKEVVKLYLEDLKEKLSE